MVERWETAEPMLVDCALADLRETDEVRPALVAFAGDALRFIAWLRPFAEGAYHEPVTELLALAVPMGCDRLMLSVGGRVWPLDRPPPAAGADGRQRAIVVHAVDGAGEPPRSWTALHPVSRGADGPQAGAPWQPGPAAGWIADALLAAVCERHRLRAPWSAIAEQAARVDALGHALHVAPEVMAWLAGAVDSPDRGLAHPDWTDGADSPSSPSPWG